MLVIVYEFVARADRVEDFEALYVGDGAWADLFRRSPGFVSTTLMRDQSDRRRYLIADRWTSAEMFEDFKRTHGADYHALDERCRRLVERETLIGRFDFLH